MAPFNSANVYKTIVKGGAGNDLIYMTINGAVTTGTGDDVVVFRGNVVGGATTATSYATYSSVLDFDVAHDKLGFGAANQMLAVRRNGSSSDTPGLSKQGSSAFASLNAGDTMVLQNVARTTAR